MKGFGHRCGGRRAQQADEAAACVARVKRVLGGARHSIYMTFRWTGAKPNFGGDMGGELLRAASANVTLSMTESLSDFTTF